MKPAAAPARHLVSAPFGVLRRKCACGGSGGWSGECAECTKKKLRRRAAGSGPETVPPIVHDVLRSPGRPLDQSTRSFFEPRFGHDFSRVRIHADGQAAESAQAVKALAYTLGPNIVFGLGRYLPGTPHGQHLLAHELAHVVQQSNMVLASRSALTIGPAESPFEGEADRMADAALSGDRVRAESAPPSLQRDIDDSGNVPPTNQSLESVQTGQATPGDESADYRELTEEEKAAIIIVGQAASTPDGNSLGPTDLAHQGCLGKNFFFARGPDTNTATAAMGSSVVTAKLGQPPTDASGCSCGCGLFRQSIRGFARLGSPTSPKLSPLTIGSCSPNSITLSEHSFTEEFVNCITGGAPSGPGCSRTQNDFPGFSSGLAEGTFVQVHFVLRYQMWDQCRGQSLGIADHVLDISGSRSPRTITFT
jgi:Domain of unknown function (DUF4157)